MRPYYCTSGWMPFFLVLLMSWGISCQSQLKNPGITEVVVEVGKNTFAESSRIYQGRLEAYGITVLSVDSLPSQGLLKLRYEGSWPQEEIGDLFLEQGELSMGPVISYREAFPVMEAINEKTRDASGVIGDNSAIAEILEAEGLSDFQSAGGAQIDEKTEKFNQENPLFALLTPPEYANYGADSQTPLVGYALSSDMWKVDGLLNSPEAVSVIPADMHFAWSIRPFDAQLGFYELIALQKVAPGGALIENRDIAKSSIMVDERNQPMVDLSMTPEGSAVWANMTRKAVGKHLAICIDKRVYSYPRVNSEITGGRSVISGSFSMAEAQNMAAVLSTKPLTFPVRISAFKIELAESGEK